MKSRIAGLLLCSLLASFASGCWDTRDINDIAFALTIGLDQPTDVSANTYRVTLEITDPDPDKRMPQSLIVSEDGDSIVQAVQRIQTKISRLISFSHLRAVIVGENLARQRDFMDLADYLMKDPQIALRLRLFFLQGDEAQVMHDVKPKLSELLATELISMGQLQKEISLVRTQHFYRFWSSLKTGDGTAIGSRIVLEDGKETLVRKGAAVYREDKLIAWLSAEEAQGANWLIEETQAVVIAREGSNGYTYRVSNQKADIVPHLENGELSFSVKVHTTGKVVEETGSRLDFSKQESIKKVEALLSETIKRQIEFAINKSQHELETDYLGFGKALEQHEPRKFRSLDWQEVFPQVPIRVKVESRIDGSGLKT